MSSTRELKANQIKNGAGLLVPNTTGTVTVPNGTDTVTTLTAAQTLTNKTLTGPVVGNFQDITEQASAPATPGSGLVRLYAKTADSKLYIKNDLGVETQVGSGAGGGAGGINYIEAGDAETGTTGWVTYADAAGAIPVDGTGGSASVTWTTTATTPLRGLTSFLLTKDAVNRQGEGVSYAFTIDRADVNSVLRIGFDYNVNSGTFVAGDASDVRVFIYDVTNTQLIYPVDFKLQSNATDKFEASFQTSNSLSYRLIFHVATTSAAAYTLKIDNVQVGPQARVLASPVTDWQTFTPPWTAATTNPTIGDGTITGAWRRVGDSIEIRGYILWGTTTSNGSGVHYFGFPSGVVIDTAKLSGSTAQNNSLGSATFHNSGTAIHPMRIQYDTSSRVVFQLWANGSPISMLAAFADGSGGSNGDELFWHLSFPVVGWGSSVQVSNDADTRVVAARYTSNSGQSIPASTVTVVDFEDVDYDTHGLVTTGGSWAFTANISGYYRVTAKVGWSTIATGNNYETFIYKNGSAYSRITSQGDNATVLNVDTVWLEPGEYIDIRATQDTAGAVALSSDATDTSVSIERVSGPSAIAANELVAVRAVNTTGQSVPNNTDTTLTFTAAEIDTHGALNISTGVFTAPVAGTYRLTSSVGFEATASLVYAYFNKNASNTYIADTKTIVGGSSSPCLNCSGLVKLAPGDTVELKVNQQSGGALNTSTTSFGGVVVSIERVGF